MQRINKGLTQKQIQNIVNFDWDDSFDEDSCEEEELVEKFIEDTLQEIIQKGERIETSLLEDIVDEDPVDCDEVVADTQETYEKVDAKHLRWRNTKLGEVNTTWMNCSDDRENYIIETPIEYFNKIFDDEIIDKICSETNVHGLKELGIELKCTSVEMRRFIGVLLYLGCVKVPQMRMAWMKQINLTAITDSISRNRFEKIKECFHLNDNSKQVGRDHPDYDNLYKVRPLLQKLKSKFNELPQEEYQSIDEQMVPYKGRQQLKQYIPNKPHKWGFKMFTRAGVSGMIYDFTLYIGEGTCPDYGLGLSSDIVLYLASGIPKNQNYKLFFDNWFSSISLMSVLKEMGILAVGTIRSNRLGNCNLENEAQLRKRGRGSFDEKTETTYNICAVRWFDNKSVQQVSNYVGAEPVGKCTRWSAREKKFLEVSRPAIVHCYNKNMGGVDLSDMLMELYRVNHRSRKWYMRLVYWCLNAAVVNSWLLYRKQLKIAQPEAKFMPLIQFQLEIANDLLKSDFVQSTPQRKRGRPGRTLLEDSNSPGPSSPSSSTSGKRKYTPEPSSNIRYDRMDHWVEWSSKGRCRMCKTGFSLSICAKCRIHLCCNPQRNCFVSYHTQ